MEYRTSRWCFSCTTFTINITFTAAVTTSPVCFITYRHSTSRTASGVIHTHRTPAQRRAAAALNATAGWCCVDAIDEAAAGTAWQRRR